jgi:DNA-binding XRE family transcriptional regulator
MTQMELAKRVGISRQTMNAIENARRAPTIDVAIRIADVFNIAVDQLFDLVYEGRPVRHEEATTPSVERRAALVEEAVKVASTAEPARKNAEKKLTFADLRKVIGP